jgi:hypothetical protein
MELARVVTVLKRNGGEIMIRFAKPYLLFAVLSITCWAQSVGGSGQ